MHNSWAYTCEAFQAFIIQGLAVQGDMSYIGGQKCTDCTADWIWEESLLPISLHCHTEDHYRTNPNNQLDDGSS